VNQVDAGTQASHLGGPVKVWKTSRNHESERRTSDETTLGGCAADKPNAPHGQYSAPVGEKEAIGLVPERFETERIVRARPETGRGALSR